MLVRCTHSSKLGVATQASFEVPCQVLAGPGFLTAAARGGRPLQVYVHVQSQARSSYHLGYWADEAEAARAYDREILKARPSLLAFNSYVEMHQAVREP